MLRISKGRLSCVLFVLPLIASCMSLLLPSDLSPSHLPPPLYLLLPVLPPSFLLPVGPTQSPVSSEFCPASSKTSSLGTRGIWFMAGRPHGLMGMASLCHSFSTSSLPCSPFGLRPGLWREAS